MAEKPDTRKYLIELTKKALREEEILNNLPQPAYCYSGNEYTIRLERRNEALNRAVVVLNEEMGYQLPRLRIHQRNAGYVYDAVKGVFGIKENSKEA